MRVRASSLNYRDLMVLKGGGRGPTKIGVVPLSDGAGEVAAIGEGVTRVKIGFVPSGVKARIKGRIRIAVVRFGRAPGLDHETLRDDLEHRTSDRAIFGFTPAASSSVRRCTR
jgi:hypothetical protein